MPRSIDWSPIPTFFLGLALSAALLSTSCVRLDPRETPDGAPPPPPPPDAAVVPGDASPAQALDVAPVDLAPPCQNLQCQQVACPGAPTSLSGTVFAPNGKLPLYNVMVYVPNAPLEPFKAGVTCDRCGVVASGQPIATALSDAHGKFKLTNVPAGKDIPLVIQVGKWRRKVTIPNVIACQDNALTSPELTRLPRNRKEGDLPKIAVATGTCDQLGCLLPKIGVDPAELGAAGEDKAIIYFSDTGALGLLPNGRSGPPNMRPSTELWASETSLGQYDMTLLSCECGENTRSKDAAALDAMSKYLARGGRVFGSHYSYIWLKASPDPALLGATTFETARRGDAATTMTIDTSFPKGKALADWMQTLDPTITYGVIEGRQVFSNFSAVMPPSALAWASSPTNYPDSSAMPVHPRILTVNTPVGVPAENQCGRVAMMDAHITPQPELIMAGQPTPPFPGACAKDLSKGEEALAFLLFDLAACIQDDTKPVIPPIP